jgi:hypothetical protein
MCKMKPLKHLGLYMQLHGIISYKTWIFASTAKNFKFHVKNSFLLRFVTKFHPTYFMYLCSDYSIQQPANILCLTLLSYEVRTTGFGLYQTIVRSTSIIYIRTLLIREERAFTFTS